MPGYVDIHAHVLYGIDDGPDDRAAAEAMLHAAAQAGTTTIAATPHLRSDFPGVHVDELAARVRELRDWIATEGLGIDLVNGGEVGLVWALDAPAEDLRLASYGQRGSDLLIETPATIAGMDALLYQIRAAGYRVTLAHPERSREFQRDPSLLLGLIERGVLLQVNADAILGNPRKSRTSALAHKLVREGRVSAVATDSHRAAEWRAVSVLPDAASALAELVGPEMARWLTSDAPAAIVAGSELPAAPPIAGTRRRWPWSRG